MVRVGIAGIGFMGMIHYLTYQKLPNAKVVALSELEKKRLDGDWRDIKGNFGPAGTMMDLSGIAKYSQVSEMIADPNIDLIDITLPPWLHSDIAVAALQAGKHVFCEKPIALSTTAASAMLDASKRSGKQLVIGHVLPFFPEYAWARQVSQSGEYGAVRGGAFRRVISDPNWLANFWNADRIGGPMLDLHVHDAHFIRWMFGMPVSVSSQGRMRGACAEYWTTQFRFADPQLAVSATSGTIDQQGRPFTHGFEIHLERGTILFDFAVLGGEASYTCRPTLLGADGQVTYPELGDGDPLNAFRQELAAVLQGVETGRPAEVLSCELARDAVLLCHKQTESVATGRTVDI